MNRILAAVASVTLFVACGGQLPSDVTSRSEEARKTTSTATKTATTPTLALHTTAAEGTTVTWQSSFTIATTSDIFFATDLASTFNGHYSLSVDVFMPGGGAYQVFTTAIAVGVAPAAGEQAAVKTATGYRVWSTMPVAGTIIQQYSLTGPWTATAYLGTSTANAAFTLN